MNTPIKNNYKVLSRMSIMLFACVLPFAFFRISFGDSSVSVASIVSVCVSIFFIVVYRQQITSFVLKNRNFLALIAIFNILLFIIALNTSTVHAFGVWFEWFVLPCIISLIFVVIYHKFKDEFLYALLVSAIIVIIISMMYIFLGHVTYDGRLAGPWGSPNTLAMIVAPLLFPFALLIQKNVGFWRIVYSAISTGLFAVLVATQSIFAFLSVAVGVLIIFILYGNNISWRKEFSWKKVAIISCIILAASVVIVIRSQIFFDDIARSSLASRITIWSVAGDLIVQNPLYGYGIETFQSYYLAQQPLHTPFLEWSAPTPHSLYLTMWFTGGMILLFTFVLILLYALLSYLRKFLLTHQKTPLFLGGALCSIGFYGFFDTPGFGIITGYILWFYIIISLQDRDDRETH